jgi:hypothetical protein
MDKRIAGLLGAAAAFVAVGSAQATDGQGNAADPGLTYRDLLNPVPNAQEALKADDARRGSTPAAATEVAQIVIGVGHHHHHHHHHARARVRIVPPVRHDHHHHHHHHNMYYGR